MYRDAEHSGVSEKLPPQNLEAEIQCLGAVLLDADALHEVLPVLAVEDFYRDAHQAIYRAVRTLADAGRTVDAVTVCDELTRTGDLSRAGGAEFLAELCQSPPHTANARYHADIIRQKADSRRVIEQANEVLKAAYSGQYTAEQLIANGQAAFMGLGDQTRGTEVTLRAACDRAMDTLDKRWRGEAPGVRLPFRKVDLMLDGFRPGRFYAVAGRPGNGKSAFLFQAADHAAMTGYGGGVPALFFTLEMDAEELAERYLSGRARVNSYAFRRPHELLKADMLARVNDAHDASRESRLRVDEAGGLTVSQIAARARRCKHRHGLGIVFVDYLQLIDGERGRGENRQEEVAKISRGLKGIAKQLNVPVVAACQLNRAVEGRTGKDARPRLSDLRESGQIEQDAHAVIMLHRPDQIDPADRPGIVEAIVPKNRGGSRGVVSLRFVAEETRFEDATEPEFVPPADF
jgi:replicative DNA helicase